MSAHERTVLVERQGAVGIVRLNRPKALNALNAKLIERTWALRSTSSRSIRRSAPSS